LKKIILSAFLRAKAATAFSAS